MFQKQCEILVEFVYLFICTCPVNELCVFYNRDAESRLALLQSCWKDDSNTAAAGIAFWLRMPDSRTENEKKEGEEGKVRKEGRTFYQLSTD